MTRPYQQHMCSVSCYTQQTADHCPSIHRGRAGDEIEDEPYNLTNPRRRSNSSSHAGSLKTFKTKFETIEPEPVFEEELHGPRPGDLDETDLEKTSTGSTGSSGSVEEEDMAEKKM